MLKNILVGNGLNLANDAEFLTIKNVYSRFINNLEKKFPFFKKAVYLENVKFEDIKILFDNTTEKGIEQIAGMVFDFFVKEIKKNGELSWNECYRLIELLSAISLESLFIVNGVVVYPKISLNYINKLNSYDKILTSKYVDVCDAQNKCYYLHGNIHKYLDAYAGQMIITNILKHTAEIREFISEEYISLDIDDVIFVPDNKIVDKYVYVGEGLFGNKCGLKVYPAADLFPSSGKGDIYKIIDEIDEIEIFGVSPFGDKSLLEKLGNINKVIIYVYNSDYKDIVEWKKYIPNTIFKDSSDFLK